MFESQHHDQPRDEAWTEPTRPPTGVHFIGAFEGRALITLSFAGQPCWLAGEIAALLGMRGASDLARRFAIDWAKDAREGVHWVRLGAVELDELRFDLRERGVVMAPSLAEASSALLVLEPGLALAVERSCETEHGSAGARLLVHVRERVVPDAAAIARPPSSPLEREAMAIARDRVELERRRWEYDALEGLADALALDAQVDPQVVWAYRVVAAEIALDGALWQLKPGIEQGWLSPTQIARRHLGVTRQRVGQVITQLGLRDSKVHSKAVLNKTAGRDRPVVSYLYSPAAVGLIERELRSRGYRRVE